MRSSKEIVTTEHAQARRVAQIEADLDVKRAQVSERSREVLTAEQVEKLKRLAGKMDTWVDEVLEFMNDKSAAQ